MYSGRPHVWLKPGEPIVCPRQFADKTHHLKTNAVINEHQLLRCVHRPAANQGECGASVYVVLHPKSGWRYVGVVSQQELLFMEHRHMSMAEILAYLGTEIPPQAR